MGGNGLLREVAFTGIPGVGMGSIVGLTRGMGPNLRDAIVRRGARPRMFVVSRVGEKGVSGVFKRLVALVRDAGETKVSRSTSTVLPCSKSRFDMPSGICVLKAVGATSESVTLVSATLHEEFRFVRVVPSSSILEGVRTSGMRSLSITTVLSGVGREVAFLCSERRAVKRTFFAKLGSSTSLSGLRSVFRGSMVPLLRRCFCRSCRGVRLMLNSGTGDSSDLGFVLSRGMMTGGVFGNGIRSIVSLPRGECSVGGMTFNGVGDCGRVLWDIIVA